MNNAVSISDQEYAAFQRLMADCAGIHLPDNKKPLIMSRLGKRLREHNLISYSQYLKLIEDRSDSTELQTTIDLLTTNETFFFREPRHFDFLARILEARGKSDTPFRVWSAACSCGQEPYSVAMMLADRLGSQDWDVLCTDISTRVLAHGKRAVYPLAEADSIPERYRSRYCLRGIGEHEGTMLIKQNLRSRLRFLHLNLNSTFPALGQFDVIFLRNVMIYFSAPTKQQLIQKLFPLIKPGGYLIIGHSETLNGINPGLRMVHPSIYYRERRMEPRMEGRV